MKRKASVALFRILMAVLIAMLILLSVVYPGPCFIGIIICVLALIKAPVLVGRRPDGDTLLTTKGQYQPEHEQYVILRCPECGKWTACPDLRAAIPGVNFNTPEETLQKLGPEKLEEVDMEFDPDNDIEEAAYCPSCRNFFDPTER